MRIYKALQHLTHGMRVEEERGNIPSSYNYALGTEIRTLSIKSKMLENKRMVLSYWNGPRVSPNTGITCARNPQEALIYSSRCTSQSHCTCRLAR